MHLNSELVRILLRISARSGLCAQVLKMLILISNLFLFDVKTRQRDQRKHLLEFVNLLYFLRIERWFEAARCFGWCDVCVFRLRLKVEQLTREGHQRCSEHCGGGSLLDTSTHREFLGPGGWRGKSPTVCPDLVWWQEGGGRCRLNSVTITES